MRIRPSPPGVTPTPAGTSATLSRQEPSALLPEQPASSAPRANVFSECFIRNSHSWSWNSLHIWVLKSVFQRKVFRSTVVMLVFRISFLPGERAFAAAPVRDAWPGTPRPVSPLMLGRVTIIRPREACNNYPEDITFPSYRGIIRV